jgi:hypothetical protein
MGNNTQYHPRIDLPRDTPINLQKLMPKKEWWTVWHYIFTGKMVKVIKQ